METRKENILECLGAYRQSEEYAIRKSLGVTFRQDHGFRQVGCTYLKEDGSCLAYRRPSGMTKFLTYILQPVEYWERLCTPNTSWGPTALEFLRQSRPLLRKCVNLYPAANNPNLKRY